MSTYTEEELNGMTRADLDTIAEDKGLDPTDYGNKTEEIVAILEAQGDTPEGDDGSTTPARPAVSGDADPLTDPEEYAKQQFPGTTSDASTRTEGTSVQDVPPDPDQGDAKATDDPNYDFPPQGDVDDATREVVEDDAELIPAPTIEDWVVLDGAHEAVPDVLDGRRAAVIQIHPVQEYYTREEYEELALTVRTRDDYGATLIIPPAAIKSVERRGVSPVRT
jgi:hypothetical protein